MIFSFIFGVVRLFLSTKMKERIKKLDKKERIFEYANADQLPGYLGGTNASLSGEWISNIINKIQNP